MGRIKTKSTTLTIIEALDDPQIIVNAIKTLIYSSKDLIFDEIQILTTDNLNELSLNLIQKYNIKHTVIKKLGYPLEFSLFCLKDLYKYIKTDHCLLVQRDGYVLNGNLWNDKFLNYDYIGAPCWDNLVGNGGFSLRSFKLLKTTADAPFELNEQSHNCEDMYICKTYRNYFLEKGINFAPVELARNFSMECYNEHYKNSLFGAHRIYNNYWDII